MDLRSLDLTKLRLRLQMVAVILERGAPMHLDEILARLAEVGAVPTHGATSLRRAWKRGSCLGKQPDGRFFVDRGHPEFALDERRIKLAYRCADTEDATWVEGGICRRPAPRVDATWVGTRRPLGGDVGGEDNLDLLVWFDTTANEVRAFDAVPAGKCPEGLAALLERAMHRPAEGRKAAVPSAVATDVETGRREVARIASLHHTRLVDDADFGNLDAVFTHLQRELKAPAVELCDVHPALLERFYLNSAALLRAEPWHEVALDEALRIDGLDPSPVYILLVEGFPKGLVVFLEESAALHTLLTRSPSPSPSLMLRYHDRLRAPAAAAAADVFHWKDALVPLPMRLEGEQARLVSQDELRLLVAVLEVVTRLTFRKPFREQRVEVDGHAVHATWPLRASPFGGPRSTA